MKTHRRSHAPANGSRRRFTKTLAAAFVAAPLAAASVAPADAQTPPAAREAAAPPDPRPTPAAQQQTQQPPSPVAEAYAAVARARFGDKLTPDELARVRRDLEGNVRTADRLRSVKLKNADEPDFVFIA